MSHVLYTWFTLCSTCSRASCLAFFRKKKLWFPQMPVYFFNQFSGDILFSSLDSFAFFLFLFFCLFACFFKLIINILIHIRLCRRVSDAKIFSRPISGNKATFLASCFNFAFSAFAFPYWNFSYSYPARKLFWEIYYSQNKDNM